MAARHADSALCEWDTGASEWNPSEHRLFAEISKHWAAEPLVGYENMLGFMRNTSTKTGLAVTAYPDGKEFPTGLKPDRQLIALLALKPGNAPPRWATPLRPTCEVSLCGDA